MNRSFIFPSLIIFVLLLTSYRCSRPFTEDQLNFGIEAAKNDLWEEAIFRWKKVLETNPDSAAAHNNLAVAYEKKGLWEEAKKEYEIALKLSPQNSHIEANYQNFKRHYEIIKDEKN
jgi:Tfp pilus assembly protein PilF